jgi:putrescine carbamoyltransferase
MVAPSARGETAAMKHFIDTQEHSRAELSSLLELIDMLKAADAEAAVPQLLAHRSLGMIFEEPSTRTRVSFEVAMAKLGGHALYLKPGEIHLGKRESLYDTAKVLSRMCDVIEARLLSHDTVLQLAAAAEVPVINGLTDYNHPTQVVCDIFTMIEHLPAGKRLQDCTVVFVGDRTNVCSSLMMITTQFGMSFVHAAPAAYQAPEQWQAIARENAARSGGSVTVTEEVEEAVAGADFVYTDLWWWVDQEDEIPERRAAFMPRYQVNVQLMARAPGHARFMHCLPASRGVEVTDEVIDGPRSIVFDQAENRLHTEKAILVWLTYPTIHRPSLERLAHHDRCVREKLHELGWDGGAAVDGAVPTHQPIQIQGEAPR